MEKVRAQGAVGLTILEITEMLDGVAALFETFSRSSRETAATSQSA